MSAHITRLRDQFLGRHTELAQEMKNLTSVTTIGQLNDRYDTCSKDRKPAALIRFAELLPNHLSEITSLTTLMDCFNGWPPTCRRAIIDRYIEVLGMIENLVVLEERYEDCPIACRQAMCRRYTELLSRIDDLATLEKRFGNCLEAFDLSIIDRYTELLSSIDDLATLEERYVNSHRAFDLVIMTRYAELLSEYLAQVTTTDEIEQRYKACPEDLQAVFLQTLALLAA